MTKKGLPGAPQPTLSPRQWQILKLLQAGKVNKEVAQELDIGLGTVKQHLVALFKKLNVSNRAMAVSRGMSLQQEQERQKQGLNSDALLERRPCVVLSLALGEDAEPQAVRLMHGSLTELAAASDAIFFARKGHAGEIIYGIQQLSAHDLALALAAANKVHDELIREHPMAAQGLRACLVAGLAVASMRRFGGWSGEAIASSAIATARELLHRTPAGYCALAPAALDLARAFGITGPLAAQALMPWRDIGALRWTGTRPDGALPMVGRRGELAVLTALLRQTVDPIQKRGGLVCICGEIGMGKSRLCAELARDAQALGLEVRLWRGMPAALSTNLYDASCGGDAHPDEVLAQLRRPPATGGELAIVDDVHLVRRELQSQLTAAALEAVGGGKLVAFAGRREMLDIADQTATTITLARQPEEDIAAIIRHATGKTDRTRQTQRQGEASRTAAGVPLFAVELARHHDTASLPLSLQIIINARLDSLPLDRVLLRLLAKGETRSSPREISAALGEDLASVRQHVEGLVAAGVVKSSADGGIAFTHPLLRQAIAGLIV